MHYDGVVYRPPSEARSLIVQLTIGCAHNQCTFCTMYKDKQFRIRSLKEIQADFTAARALYGSHIRRIFLADGDALIMRTPELLEILNFVKSCFPEAERITSYGTPSDINRKSEEELVQLRQEGLQMIYMGAESGDAVTLGNVRKGVSREEIIAAGHKLRACGIKSSVTLISGLGGRERLQEHAVGSADLVSQMKPDYVGFLTLMLERDALIMDDIRAGRLTLLEAEDVVEEMQLFLQNVDSEGTVFRSNHASNYIVLKGTLNDDVPHMLRYLEEIKEQNRFRPERARRL
ncbi:MAG: radical SAM protein [Lachnospiraceae bacterium]|nr:radical SAM protein [Lachnospiraceae bacterium]